MTQAMLEKGIGNHEVKGNNQVSEAGTIVTRFKCTLIHVEMAHDPTLVLLVIAKLSIEVPQHNQFVTGRDLFQAGKRQVVEGLPFNPLLNTPILAVSGRVSREHYEVLPNFGLKMRRDQTGAMLVKEEQSIKPLWCHQQSHPLFAMLCIPPIPHQLPRLG
jgi:hypothetical protein